MKIVIKNGKLTLCPSKEKENIQIKFKPHESTIGGIKVGGTEYAYADWEVSERKSNITEFLQCVRDCCKYGIYTKQDILDYQKFIEQQNDLKTEPNKTYYDSRAVIDEMDKNFTSSSLIPHDTFDIQQAIQNRGILFWIEIRTSEKNELSLHICFYTIISKAPRISPYQVKNEDEPFELIDNKYMILEACRVFAALGKYKERIQNKLKVCLDLIKIAKTFGLRADEYMLDTIGQNNSYSIYPIDRSSGEVIVKNFPEDLEIFNDYELTFKHCIFMLEKENKKDLQMGLSSNNTAKKAIIFDTCTFKGDISFCGIIFGEEVCFKNSTFECPVSFMGIHFKSGVDFSQTNFKEKVSFSKSNFEILANFSDSHFKDEAFFKDSIFQHVSFKNAIFHSNANFNNAKFQAGEACKTKDEYIADFSRAHFKERALFTESIFHKKVNFSNVTFDHNAYFDKAKFEKEVNFSQAEFYKNAHFYGTEFEEFPNFIQVIFNENVNFINTKSNIKFEKARKQIETLYIEKKTEYDNQAEEDKEEPKKHKIANEFRDSFRNIKSALIKDNNMLDASKYHRIELYCKELELEYRREEKAEGSGFRDIVDRIQLMLYRLTSDHHTDLLLILNNVIILIACFGAVNFVFNLPSYNYFKVNSLTIGHAIGALIACFIFAILAICLILGCCGKLLDFFGLIINKARLFLSKSLFYKEQDTTCPRACIVFFSYIATIIILVAKPALLVPIFGQMIDSKSSIGFAFASLNIIYAIFMFLLIFSLQKTARKNTIVPS